jgi:hypothetical protein
MRRIVSAALLLCLGTAPVLLSTPAFADTTGGTICGNTWQDLNGDGIRQAQEPAMPNVGLSIGSGPFINTVSDDNGNYCFTGVAAGTYHVQANDLAFFGDRFGYTKPGPDSRFDWTTGQSRPITITARQDGSFTQVDHVDVGYLKAANDQHAVRITVSKHGKLHVGDTFEIRGYVGLNGNVPQQLGVNLTLPAGLTILNTTGDMSTFVAQPLVEGVTGTRRLPGAVDFLGIQVRVDQPLDNGAIQLQTTGDLYPDINPNDNTLTRYLSAGA